MQVIEKPEYEKAKGYYHNGQMRIEMPPVGNDHASDHTIVIVAVTLYAAIKNIALNGKDNCTYRKPGVDEAQPDASFYIGENADAIPWGTNIINLNSYPPPTLAIEVAETSLADDKGEKRLLYEELGVVMGTKRSIIFKWFHEQRDPTAETVVDIAKTLQEIEPAAAAEFVRLYLGDFIDNEG